METIAIFGVYNGMGIVMTYELSLGMICKGCNIVHMTENMTLCYQLNNAGYTFLLVSHPYFYLVLPFQFPS